MKIFGFSFGSTVQEKPSGVNQFVTPSFTEPTLDLQSGGFMSPTATSLQISATVHTENDAIKQYRDIARQPEVDLSLEEIICEMIVGDHDEPAVSLNMDNVEFPNKIKDRINEEFTTILGLLDFNMNGHNIAKRWYIDGRVNYLVSIDDSQPQLGIQQLQYVEPFKIKRVRDIERSIKNGYPVVKSIKEYYIYNESGIDQSSSVTPTIAGNAMVLTVESVVHCNSGLYDADRGFVISALDTAIRTVNSLRMVEESGIIYMMTRAPERRVFYIDVGNLPKAKINQYIQEIADKYRTKILYDPVTGKVKNEKRFMAMTEDYFIPRQGGSRGTEIDTLPAGQGFDNTSQLDYFKGQLWNALKVPSSRFQDGTLYTHGTEITRDELRFFKYIQRQRLQFSKLFLELLERQLVLKGIMGLDDWENFKDNVIVKYNSDNYFSEAVANEILQSRMNILTIVDGYVGKWFGPEYVYSKVLHMTEEEAEKEQASAQAWQLKQIQNQQNQNQLQQQLTAEGSAQLQQILAQQGIQWQDPSQPPPQQ